MDSIIEFTERFKTNYDYLFYLADIKWTNSYKCPKCGHSKYCIRKVNLARECNGCHHIVSPTANTLFHRKEFGSRKEFMIAFELRASTKGLSSSQVAKRYKISRNTPRAFMLKVRNAMTSSQQHSIEGKVQVEEFVFGGKEILKQVRSQDNKNKKIVGADELMDDGKVKQCYFK